MYLRGDAIPYNTPFAKRGTIVIAACAWRFQTRRALGGII